LDCNHGSFCHILHKLHFETFVVSLVRVFVGAVVVYQIVLANVVRDWWHLEMQEVAWFASALAMHVIIARS
jgi:hypothetical protein